MALRLRITGTVRFNFRAIRALSIFESNSANSCASSAGVHGRPLGRGPSFILLSPSAELYRPPINEETEYPERLARNLLIEFVGGEPAAQLRDQFV